MKSDKMVEHVKKVSQEKYDAVKAEILRSKQKKLPITVKGIAKRAKVTPQYIYKQPDLLSQITALRDGIKAEKDSTALSGAGAQKKIKILREQKNALYNRVIALEAECSKLQEQVETLTKERDEAYAQFYGAVPDN